MMKKIMVVFFVLLLPLFSSCNSGGGTSSPEVLPPPSPPKLLTPSNGATITGKFVVLSWQKNKLKNLRYTLYFGRDKRDLREVVANFPYNSYTLWITASGKYYWKIDATYGKQVTFSEMRWFNVVNKGNRAPYPPEILYPDGSTLTIYYLKLLWKTGIDPDGDSVSCKVYLGNSIGDLHLIEGKSCNNFREVGPLANGTYWWKVEECDSYGLCSTSSIASFTVSMSENKKNTLNIYPFAPTNGTIIHNGDIVKFVWRGLEINSLVSYSILVSINGGDWERIANGLNVTYYYYRPPVNNARYKWKIVAYLGKYGIEIPSEISTFSTSSSPGLVPLSKRAIFFDLAGNEHGNEGICVINTFGQVICWGYNDKGSLGKRGTSAIEPLRIHLADNEFFVDLSISSGIGCAISFSGKLYCWGADTKAKIEPYSRLYDPMEVSVGGVLRWKKVSAGYGPHVCAISSSGKLYCWGDNSVGELAQGNSSIGFSYTPLEVTAPDGGRWIDVSAGGKFTCAIEEVASIRKLYCWGSQDYGELGNGKYSGYVYSPVSPLYSNSVTGWSSVYTGYGFACGLTERGKLYCWGGNDRGQVGAGMDLPIIPYPVEVTDPRGAKWTLIGIGFNYVCAQDDGNFLYCWGNRADDEGYGLGKFLGEPFERYANNYSDIVTYPTFVTSDSHWKLLDGSAGVTCGMDKLGNIFCAGNREGNRIFGDLYETVYISNPVKIEMYPGQKWVDIGMSRDNICGTDMRGNLLCWGRNNGDLWPQYGSRVVPTPLFPGHRWVKIGRYNFYYGNNHYFRCAIDSEGKMYCWGHFVVDGYYGDSPVEVSNPDGNKWEDVDAGNLGVCAVDSAGKLFCWGKSLSDRSNLGLGPIDRDFPTPQSMAVPTNVYFKKVSLGYFIGCALADNGDLYCWGDSDWIDWPGGGDQSFPAKYTNLSGPFLDVSNEYDTICVLKEDGEVWCQGKIVYPNATVKSSGPWSTVGGNDWIDISSAFYSSCALSAHGDISCWNKDIGLEDVNLIGYNPKKLFIEGNGIGCFLDDHDSLYCWGDNSKDYIGGSCIVYPVKVKW